MSLRKYLPQSFWGLHKHYLKLEPLIMLVCAFTLTSDFSACKCAWSSTAWSWERAQQQSTGRFSIISLR